MRKLAVAIVLLAAVVVLLSAGPLTTAQSGTTVAAPAAAEMTPSTWRILMIIFRETDTDYMGLDGQWHHMTVSLEDSNIDAMLTSLNGPVADAVREWSDGAVQWDIDVRYAPRPITYMSGPDSDHKQWVDPASIQDVIDGFSPDGVYDQIMVYWPGDTPSAAIPTRGWGLALYYNASRPWGYLAVEQGPTEWWNPVAPDLMSQVWIHEWLHVASSFYAYQGYPMPAQDADGAALHGYVQGQGGLPGWGRYYADLMQGKVLEGGQHVGITRDAWLSGTILTGVATSSADWRGEYFSNQGLAGTPSAYRDDETIDFDWGMGAPIAGVPVDNFSVRWTADVAFSAGTYRFSTVTDDGVRLYVDGTLVIDSWVDQAGVTRTAERSLAAGNHTVVMEYYENGGAAVARLWWIRIGGSATSTTTTLPTTTTTTAPSTTTTTAPPGTTTTTLLQRFPDVPAWHLYATQINDLAARDIIVGNPDGTFGPEDWVKRQQFAKMIVLTLGLPTSESDVSPFSDVDTSGPGILYPDHYVAVCARAGITVGTGPGSFSPWNEISRAQLITMVGRAAALPDPPLGYNPAFSNFSDTHFPWARRAAYAGLLQGLQGVGPSWDFWAPATRGEVSAILYNLLHR